MAEVKWVPIEFNNATGTGSNAVFNTNDKDNRGKIRQVYFRNQGSAIASIRIGSVGGVEVTLLPRENVSFPCFGNDFDTTTYYIKWTGAGSKSVIALIQKNVD